jgi:pimeloyl-ACP methyl ester carboxylesterase
MSQRTVVLVHGNPETAAIWGPLVGALRSMGHDEIVALSPPGFGAPLPDGFDPTMDSYADWLVGELESIRATGAEIDLLGHDWGAGHVYGTLARRPELVRTWTGDIAGILHSDYVWHDMAQAWQTPEIGEQVVAGITGRASTTASACSSVSGCRTTSPPNSPVAPMTRWGAASCGSTAREPNQPSDSSVSASRRWSCRPA